MTKREIMERFKNTVYHNPDNTTAEHCHTDLVMFRALLDDLAADVRAEETPRRPEADRSIRSFRDARVRVGAILEKLPHMTMTHGTRDQLEQLYRDLDEADVEDLDEDVCDALDVKPDPRQPGPVPLPPSPKVWVIVPHGTRVVVEHETSTTLTQM